jgi:endonuclease-3
VIKELSRVIVEKLGGNLEGLLAGDVEEVREKLLTLPGIGPKTADILLLFHLNKPVIPVDTHVMRVSKRLGLAPKKGGYEQVRAALEDLYDEGDYMDVHHLLIKLGRTHCKARNPLCKPCPVKELCPSVTQSSKKSRRA